MPSLSAESETKERNIQTLLLALIVSFSSLSQENCLVCPNQPDFLALQHVYNFFLPAEISSLSFERPFLSVVGDIFTFVSCDGSKIWVARVLRSMTRGNNEVRCLSSRKLCFASQDFGPNDFTIVLRPTRTLFGRSTPIACHHYF